jgi:multiple sugar transport system permease protein
MNGRKRQSLVLNLLMTVMLLYAVLPLLWLVVNSTKTQRSLFTTFGLWFGGPFVLWSNIHQVLTYDNGIFVRWLGNTLLYVVAGAGGATALATLAGYGLAKYRFPGRRAVFAVVLAAVAVPGELLDAARIDGAGEFLTFFRISLRLLGPGVVTVLLFTIVATWNNYFLPLIMLSQPRWYPLTVGLNDWNIQSYTAGGQAIYNLVITGSLLTVIPIMIAFLVMQRYWRSGLAAGSVKQ